MKHKILKFTAIGLAVIFAIVVGLLFAMFVIVPDVEQEKEEIDTAQIEQDEFINEKYSELETEFVEGKEYIVEVERNDRVFLVEINDEWDYLSDEEKTIFARSVHQDLRAIAVKSELTDASQMIDVTLTRYGKTVAQRNVFDGKWEFE